MITIPKDYYLGKELFDMANMHKTNIYKFDAKYLSFGGSRFYHKNDLLRHKKIANILAEAKDFEFYQATVYMAKLFGTTRGVIRRVASHLNWEKRLVDNKLFYRIDDEVLEFFKKHNDHVTLWLYNGHHDEKDFTDILIIDVGNDRPIRFGAWI